MTLTKRQTMPRAAGVTPEDGDSALDIEGLPEPPSNLRASWRRCCFSAATRSAPASWRRRHRPMSLEIAAGARLGLPGGEQYAPGRLAGASGCARARGRLHARQRSRLDRGCRQAPVQPSPCFSADPRPGRDTGDRRLLAAAVSRPEITRIRPASAPTRLPRSTLLERGLIEEAGRSPSSAAVLYRTGTTSFLRSCSACARWSELPDVADSGTPLPRSGPSCASGCCAPGCRPSGHGGGRTDSIE